MSTVRVATYNLYLGADLSVIFGARSPEHLREQARMVHAQLLGTDFPARAEAIARLLVRERVDVVGLQEVARWSRSRLGPDGVMGPPQVWCDFLTELLATLERAGTPYDAHAASANFHGGAALSEHEAMSVVGYNVVLVRRDSTVVVTGAWTAGYATSLDIATGMDDLVLTVARSWGGVDAVVDRAAFRFVNTHTEAYDAAVRDAQRDELVAALGDPRTPVVVAGDFNASPDSVGMPGEFRDAWVAAGDGGDGSTCGQCADLTNAESLLSERIDYLWVRGAEVTACRVVGNTSEDRTTDARLWPSDHACVLADLRLQVT
ncbi:MAG TPA: endonuclease/exonuclease/phosphatase family protein [Nocardioidaceae bacterium]|nr:endonuclease/exonuclease/phosphatase family protein [Nocardioidaceae bacterium]